MPLNIRRTLHHMACSSSDLVVLFRMNLPDGTSISFHCGNWRGYLNRTDVKTNSNCASLTICAQFASVVKLSGTKIHFKWIARSSPTRSPSIMSWIGLKVMTLIRWRSWRSICMESTTIRDGFRIMYWQMSLCERPVAQNMGNKDVVLRLACVIRSATSRALTLCFEGPHWHRKSLN